jgi:hypothetical protein
MRAGYGPREAMRNCWNAATAWNDADEKMYQRMQYSGPHRRSALQMLSLVVTMFSLPTRGIRRAETGLDEYAQDEREGMVPQEYVCGLRPQEPRASALRRSASTPLRTRPGTHDHRKSASSASVMHVSHTRNAQAATVRAARSAPAGAGRGRARRTVGELEDLRLARVLDVHDACERACVRFMLYPPEQGGLGRKRRADHRSDAAARRTPALVPTHHTAQPIVSPPLAWVADVQDTVRGRVPHSCGDTLGVSYAGAFQTRMTNTI